MWKRLVLVLVLAACVEWNPAREPIDTLESSELPVALGAHWTPDVPAIAKLTSSASMRGSKAECSHRVLVLKRTAACDDDDRALRTALLGRVEGALYTRSGFADGELIRAERPEGSEIAVLRSDEGEACPNQLLYYRSRCTRTTWAAARWRELLRAVMP